MAGSYTSFGWLFFTLNQLSASRIFFFETFTCFTSIMCYFWKDDIFNHERGYAESEVKKTSLLYDKNVKELFLCLRNLQGQNNNTKTRYGYIFIIQLNSGSFFLKLSIFCFSLPASTSLKLVVRKCIVLTTGHGSRWWHNTILLDIL